MLQWFVHRSVFFQWTYDKENSDCPCESNCPEGCSDCPNIICKNSILVLNSFSFNESIRIKPNGEIVIFILNFKKLKWEISGGQDINLNFTMSTNTTAYYSCSTILNDEMLVFGGTEPGAYTKQVHISFQKALIWFTQAFT